MYISFSLKALDSCYKFDWTARYEKNITGVYFANQTRRNV